MKTIEGIKTRKANYKHFLSRDKLSSSKKIFGRWPHMPGWLETHSKIYHVGVEPDIRALHSGVGDMEQPVINRVGPFLLEKLYSGPKMKQELELTA